jgi:hypothetical protein
MEITTTSTSVATITFADGTLPSTIYFNLLKLFDPTENLKLDATTCPKKRILKVYGKLEVLKNIDFITILEEAGHSILSLNINLVT